MDLDRLTDTILSQLFIELEASGRHVHVTREQAMALFGHALTPERPLSQPGQFLSRERVTVKGPKGEFQNVAVLGPERKAGQVEISLTDCRQLGLSAPVRLSGDIGGTPRGAAAWPPGHGAAARGGHRGPAACTPDPRGGGTLWGSPRPNRPAAHLYGPAPDF